MCPVSPLRVTVIDLGFPVRSPMVHQSIETGLMGHSDTNCAEQEAGI